MHICTHTEWPWKENTELIQKELKEKFKDGERLLYLCSFTKQEKVEGLRENVIYQYVASKQTTSEV